MHEHRRKRLLALIADHYGGDRRLFCDAGDLSESRLAQLLSSSYRGGRGFGEKAARALEARLSLDTLYFDLFAVNDISARHAYRRHARNPAAQEDGILIPQMHLTLTPGSARPDMEELPASLCIWQLPGGWLKARDLSPDQLIAVAVSGAAMSPRLQDGDVVVVDTGATAPRDGAVYLINYRGEAVIKRLVLDFGRWFMSSDNPSRKHYPREEFGDDCVLIGRIVLAAGEHI